MKKSCGKKLWRACVGILLTLAVWITAAPYAVAAETTGDAKSQAQEIRQIQDNMFPGKQERKEKNSCLSEICWMERAAREVTGMHLPSPVWEKRKRIRRLI